MKIRHERESKLSRNSKVKNKESQVFFCLQKCSSWKEENRKNEKRKILRKEKTVFVRFFLEKICEGESLNTNFFLQHFGKKKANRNFVFDKSKKWESKEAVSTVQSTNKEFFFPTKRRYCVPIFSKVFSTLWKIDIGKWHKENRFRKDVTKKESKGEKKVVEMRRHWSGSAPKSQFTQHNSH